MLQRPTLPSETSFVANECYTHSAGLTSKLTAMMYVSCLELSTTHAKNVNTWIKDIAAGPVALGKYKMKNDQAAVFGSRLTTR